jgi:hypothetical protein
MGSNGTSFLGGVAITLPVLLDSAANRIRPESAAAARLRAVAAEVREAVNLTHMPLLDALARLCTGLAPPLGAG